MKKTITTLILLCIVNISIAKEYHQYLYQEFQSSENKEEFLTKFMIKEMNEWKKEQPKKITTICSKVDKYKIIYENNFVAHVQISCINMKENWKGSLIKIPTGMSIALSCSAAKIKYDSTVWCRGKL